MGNASQVLMLLLLAFQLESGSYSIISIQRGGKKSPSLFDWKGSLKLSLQFAARG